MCLFSFVPYTNYLLLLHQQQLWLVLLLLLLSLLLLLLLQYFLQSSIDILVFIFIIIMATPIRDPSSNVMSLPLPSPKAPLGYPDLYGKRREMARIQMLEREISFLEVSFFSSGTFALYLFFFLIVFINLYGFAVLSNWNGIQSFDGL